MYTQYKVEFFNRSNLTFKSFSSIEQPTIVYDYLTLSNFNIEIQNVNVSKGDFASITDQNATILYQGVVNDIEIDKTTKQVTLVPLISIFDTEVLFGSSTVLETFIGDAIRANFINNTDTLQNLPMTVTEETSTTASIEMENPVSNLYTIITKALTAHNILVSLSFANQALSCVIKKVAATASMEAHTKNVLEKSIIVGDSYGEANKIVVVDKSNTAQTATYYLHTDGTVSSTDTDRITPVFFAYELISVSSSFAEESLNLAKDRLTPQIFNNEIELTIPKTSALIPTSLGIGVVVDVYDEDNCYTTLLTGYEIYADTIKYIFGCVRSSLTKKLIIERRNQS